MDQDLITDITLDHLPDLSESSISFQIPSNDAPADLLLADHTGGFDLLCNAVDDDISFAPVRLTHPRGPPLTLGELTPRVHVVSPSPRRSQSPTPTQVPSASAKPSVIQRTLTLGHASPEKRRKTPSRVKSIHRQLESPLVSSERFQQLRTEIGTLGQADESPTHVQMHVMVSVEDSSSSHVNPKMGSNALASHPPSEVPLAPILEEKDTCQDDEPPADKNVVIATGDTCLAEAIDVAVPAPAKVEAKSKDEYKASGGISKRTTLLKIHVAKKAKGKPSRVQEAHPSAARQPISRQYIAAEKELPEKTQITHPSTSGLAERLVSYSQKLISSIGLSKPCPENSFREASNDAVRVADARIETRPPAADASPSLPPQCINETSSDHGEPFRLSEISPHKQPLNSPKSSSPAYTGVPQHGKASSHKRVSMDADQPEEFHQRKRGRTIFADATSERGSSNEAVSQGQPRPAGATHMHEDQSIMHPETRDSAQGPDSSKAILPSARTKYKPKLTSSSECKGPTLDAFPYLSCSRQVHERMNKGKGKRDGRQRKATSFLSKSSPSEVSGGTHPRHDKRARHENAIESSHARQRSGLTSTADLPLIEKKPNATLSVAQLTKPVGFTFRVDARLEARKAEERLAVSEPGKTQLRCPVPEDKAYRTSRQAAFTFHRPEGIVPSVPAVPFFSYTEQRAKEREKFDEMVKRKEEDMQRLKEEQRRCNAEEEERAIKELRRKAIPKANEMPEWYADMPKRKGTAV
ncbi:hypothetical protein EV363DRAFT_1329982 [Boletus edulis]|nr:hypothetical protein EV363DRAFT_1329982 [Boletus edulis]